MKIRKRILLYTIVLSIPAALGLAAWQSARYTALKNEVKLLDERQQEWIDNNKKLITDIAILSSSARIEEFAKNNLGLDKKKPEDVLQVRIEREE
ncbi:hypothetical protein AGMMS50212_08990 [Spirochaetia bacterium]|nr:hypothetical protein AGMMS50212_08990 [Spirochaetia bacterium]